MPGTLMTALLLVQSKPLYRHSDLGPPLGLVINSSKCELYGDCDLQPFPSEMKKCNAFNFEILGAPIGDTIFCAKFIAENRAGASKFLALLKEVGSLDSQVAFNWYSFANVEVSVDLFILLDAPLPPLPLRACISLTLMFASVSLTACLLTYPTQHGNKPSCA